MLASAVILSLFAAAWLRLKIPGDQLYYIRLEQVFGFLSVVYLYVAVIASPLSKVVGEKRSAMRYLLFARRAIGVSAAYFAALHALIALLAQIGGFSELGLLPERFVWSLAFGAFSLVVLLIMAATSFDKVIAFMTPPRWKLLHRLIYAGGILIILHVWMIGTHVVYPWVKISGLVALAIFFGLESWRITNNLAKRFQGLNHKDYMIVLAINIWAVWIALLLILPSLVNNHHSEHRNHDHPGAHERMIHD